MLPYCDEVIHAEMQERRSRLMAQAAERRMVRELRLWQPATIDRLLAAMGARLVGWGERMQRRSAQAAMQQGAPEIYPA